MSNNQYRVTGDHDRMVYSTHKTQAAAERAAKALNRKWAPNNPGSEARAEKLTNAGWVVVK